MANKLVRVSVLGLLVACVAGASVPSPSFVFSYTGPVDGTVSQSYSGPTNEVEYKWGYQYPGQEHTEQKTYDGRVKGGYAFTDANGEVQKVLYQAAPVAGFTVEQSAAAPTIYGGNYGPNDQIDIANQATVESFYQIQANLRSGLLEPFQQEGDSLVYRVRDSLIDEVQGSVSALATRLGVDLVAGRHDQQVPSSPATLYRGQSDSSNKGVLETSEQPDGTTIYVVRIPETS